MTRRVVAWAILLLALWGAYALAKRWSNPWGAAVPVTALMPAMPQGCAKDPECAK